MSAKSTNGTDKQVGERIRAKRLERELSQKKLATAIGITFPQLQKYESGTNRVTVSRLQQIAQALGTDLTTMLHGIDDASGSVHADRAPDATMEEDRDALVEALAGISDANLRSSLIEIARGLGRSGKRG